MKNQKIVGYVWFMFVFAVGPFMIPVRADNETKAYTNAELRENSVFAEAEDFVLPKGWSVVNGHGIDMYVPAVSCGKTVRNPVEGTATLNVTIPKDGTYSMILWFTKWSYDRSLELRVEQNGVIIASSKFNRPQDRQANWSYNVQVGEQTAPLKAGPARLLLYGPPFAFGYGVGSPVDCVLLTKLSLKKMDVKNATSGAGANFGYLLTSSGEQIDWHAFTPQCFVRFTILTTNTPAVTAEISSSWHHAPWWSSAPVIGDAVGKPVPQGTPSAWSDISKALDMDQVQATIWFMFKGAERMPSVWRLRLEIASQPAANAVLRVFEENWDDDAVGYVMSGNVPKYPDQIESVSAVTERHFNLLRNIFPLLPGGDKDLRPRVLSITSSDENRSPRLLIKEAQVLAMMGINALFIHDQPHQDAAAGAGMDFSKAETLHFIHDIGLTECSFDPVLKSRLEKNLTDWAENMKKNEPIQFQNIRYVALADEPWTPNGLTHITTCSRCQEAFRKWLQMRGATPQQLGVMNWDEIKPVMTDPKTSLEQRRLGWLSSVFAQEITPLPFKNATEILQKTFGRPIGTRINFSDECVNGYGGTMSNGNGLNWFEFSRMAATTLPCTEDFSWNPHITGFLTDLLRSTATTRDLPLMLFITWGYAPPADPNSAALRTMSAVARGGKILNHYQYGPYYSSTECAFSEDGQYIKSVAYVNRVLGLADDILGKALVPDRKVAILWSQTMEQWKTDDAFVVERRMLHHALTMQQIPVDFICERDIPERIREYKVLYLPANNLLSTCVPAIASWVRAGGTLVVCGGGPGRDEANEPSLKLSRISGLSNVEMRKDTLNYRGETLGLAHVKPSTRVGIGSDRSIPVAGYKAVLVTHDTPGIRVLGKYDEGGVAIVEKRFGRGKILTFGFNPGMSLLVAMDPVRCPTFWNVFPEIELKLISAPVIEAGVVPPVRTDVGVDAARLDGTSGSAITLANFTLKPVEKLRVLVRGMNDVKKVVSCVQGTLSFRKTSEGIEIELPLQSVDVLKLYTREKIITSCIRFWQETVYRVKYFFQGK